MFKEIIKENVAFTIIVIVLVIIGLLLLGVRVSNVQKIDKYEAYIKENTTETRYLITDEQTVEVDLRYMKQLELKNTAGDIKVLRCEPNKIKIPYLAPMKLLKDKKTGSDIILYTRDGSLNIPEDLKEISKEYIIGDNIYMVQIDIKESKVDKPSREFLK